MKNDKANQKSTKADKALAKSTVEGYHQGNEMEDKLLRKEVHFTMLICMVTSPWWTATNDTMRDHIIHHMVQVDDTMDALDVMYN